MAFPSLVGGTLVREDLAPSIVFAILYGSLMPLAAFRLLGRTSRTALLVGTILFGAERVVMFSLRAVQSRDEAKAGSHGLATYEQLTMGMGYIGISQGLVNFLRVLLVNSTKPDSSDESPTPETSHDHTRVLVNSTRPDSRNEFPTPKAFPDHPRARFWYRRLSEILHLAFISAIAPGVISGTNYYNGTGNAEIAGRVMTLRYASSGVVLCLTTTIGVISLVAPRKVRRVNKPAASTLVILSSLLSSVAIYRLAIMHNTMDSLLSRGPGSLSSRREKALFYIFHMLPEWLASAILLGLNVRQIFASGPFGDWRATNPKGKPETLVCAT